MGHNRGNSLALFLLAFQHVLEQRLPEASSRQGPVRLRAMDAARAWLADNSTWKDGITRIMPARGFKGDASRMSWLPDEDIAFIYRGLASYGNPLQLTRAGHPPAYRAGEPVVLECTAFGDAPWKSLVVYEGSKRVGNLKRDQPQLVIKGPHAPGAHAAVLVGELPDDKLRTSLPVEWVVWPVDRSR